MDFERRGSRFTEEVSLAEDFINGPRLPKPEAKPFVPQQKNVVVERGFSRREIEAKLASVGDYVKMDFLQKCLKKQLDFDTKKFVLTKLSAIYESRKMYLEAGKLTRISADINTTFDGKINDFTKSIDLFIKAGAFDEADVSLAKAIAESTNTQKSAVKNKVKEWYKAYAADCLKSDKRKHAMLAYEKILSMEINPAEKTAIQRALLPLYEKLGRVTDYMSLKKILG